MGKYKRWWNINNLYNNESLSLEAKFIKEKNILKNIVYDEIELLEKKEATDIVCSMEMLKDAIFVIDKGFEDLIRGLSQSNLKDRERKLHLFKESLTYTIYGE